MRPITIRYLIAVVAAGLGLIAVYAYSANSLAMIPSGRTPIGFWLGVSGTAFMLGAALYSWRRRYIAAASKVISVTPEKRSDLRARERMALEQLQALQRQLLRNPKQSLSEVRREASAIVKNNGVGRTIRVSVVARTGAPPRLDVGRREWGGRLQTWYLWHLSLGALSLLLILLHSGLRFGNAIATLAFVCLAGVVLTGLIGVGFYWIVPPRLTKMEERAELSPEELREEHVEVVAGLESLVEGKSKRFKEIFEQEVSIPGIPMKPTIRWLWGDARIERDTSRPDRLRLIVREIPSKEQEDFRHAMRLIFRKEKIEVSLYPQLRYDYLLRAWLSVHIPLSAGMWGFSTVHILQVFFY